MLWIGVFAGVCHVLLAWGLWQLVNRRIQDLANRRMVLLPAITGVGVFFATTMMGLEEIARSTSSTAAVGLVFLPFYAAFFGVIGFLNLFRST